MQFFLLVVDDFGHQIVPYAQVKVTARRQKMQHFRHTNSLGSRFVRASDISGLRIQKNED